VEGLNKFRKFNDFNHNRTSDLPAFSITPKQISLKLNILTSIPQNNGVCYPPNLAVSFRAAVSLAVEALHVSGR
jgi:hypothetical protein